MENKRKISIVQWVTLITFIVMVTVNGLANSIKINGNITGDVSDSYPNLFAPAGLTFTIWGVIYLLLGAYTLYQLGLFRKNNEPMNEALLKRVGVAFSISSLANAAWIFAWHYLQIGLSTILMLIILACLIYINLTIHKEPLSKREKFFIRVPFSVYFGWITVATIANVTTWLVDLKWSGFGISEPVWMILILLVGTLITGATTILQRNPVYGLVPIWAYLGILYRHIGTEANYFAGQYMGVIITVTVCLVLLVLAVIVALREGKNSRPVAAA